MNFTKTSSGLMRIGAVALALAVTYNPASAASKVVEMDPKVSFADQLKQKTGQVILISTFQVDPAEADAFLEGFKHQADIMKKQPGLLFAQLHRGIAGSSTFVNYVVWDSVDSFKAGYNRPEFQEQLKKYPPSTVVSAGFFDKVPIEGMGVWKSDTVDHGSVDLTKPK